MLDRLFRASHVTALDIGARGGITSDLSSIEPAVRWFVFEPDLAAAEILERNSNARTCIITDAVGGHEEHRSFNLYRQRGCSSLLTANASLAERYGRGDLYVHERTVNVRTKSLDELANTHAFSDAAFMKIDIQGAELDAFSGAQQLLQEALLAVRSEVSFIPMYYDQPLFGDVARTLGQYGFSPYRFVEMDAWRRDTRTKYPRLVRRPRPEQPALSHGQMIQADVLFMKDIETVDDVQKRLALALIAYAYGHLDITARAFADAATQEQLLEQTQVDSIEWVRRLSREFQRREWTARRRERRKNWLRRLKRRQV